MHAGHAERQRISIRESAQPEQGCGHWDLCLAGEGGQFGGGTGGNDSAACQNHRFAGQSDGSGQLGNLFRASLIDRLVSDPVGFA